MFITTVTDPRSPHKTAKCAIPLSKMTHDVTVNGKTILHKITMMMRNELDRPIEVNVELHPPGQSIVHACEATFSGITIKANVKEKETAKKEYNDAIKRGDSAFIAETTDTTLFIMNIGRILPGVDVSATLELAYQLENYEEIGKLRMMIPLTIGNRYAPYQYDNTGRSWSIVHNVAYGHRNRVNHKPYDVEIFGDIRVEGILKSVTSLTHSMKVYDMNSQDGKAKFSFTNIDNLDKDIVVIIERSIPISEAYYSRLPYIAGMDIKYATRANVVIPPNKLPKPNPIESEYVLLIDNSGSMDTTMGNSKIKRLDAAKNAAIQLIGVIPIGAKFRVISYETNFSEWHNDLSSERHNDLSMDNIESCILAKKSACDWVRSLRSRGGTELMKAFDHIGKTIDQRKNTPVILMTDGDIGNERDIFAFLAKNQTMSVFVVGISNEVSQNSIIGMATRGRGRAEFINSNDSPQHIANMAISLMRSANNSLLKNIKNYSLDVITNGGEVIQIEDNVTLFEAIDNTFHFLTSEPINAIKVSYTDNIGVYYEDVIMPKYIESEHINIHVGGSYLQKLLAHNTNGLSNDETTENKELRKRIIAFSEALNILTPYTAFIGVKQNTTVNLDDMETFVIPHQTISSETVSSQPYNDYSSYNSPGDLGAGMFGDDGDGWGYSNYSEEECGDLGGGFFGGDDGWGNDSVISVNEYNKLKSYIPEKSYILENNTQQKIVQKIEAKFVIIMPFKGLVLSELVITSITNESIIDHLKKIGYDIRVDVNIDDIIELTRQPDANMNGYYKIVSIGSDTEPWLIARV